MWATLVILKNTAQCEQPPNGQKFAQSGHPVSFSISGPPVLPGLPDGLFSNQKSQFG
jgi:hypothetical protein